MPAPTAPPTQLTDTKGLLTAAGRAFLEFYARLIRGAPANRRITWGTGTPESAVTGSIGDLFVRTDGGASTVLYVKESGTATDTGWAAK